MYQKNVVIIIWTKTNPNKFRVKVRLKKSNPKKLGVENYSGGSWTTSAWRCHAITERKSKCGFRNTLSWPGTTEMEMPFSDVCWLIKFIATNWETLISSLLSRPHSSLGAYLRQSHQALCRDVSLGSRRNEPDFIPKSPLPAQFLQVLCWALDPVVVGRCVKQPQGEPTYGCLPVPLVWKDLAERSRLLRVYYTEILAAETHFWDKNST